jgi:septation ring formation regulator EzrA
MTQSPVTVTYSLEDVLARIENKLDNVKADGVKLSEQIKNIKIGLAEVKTEVKGIKEDIKEIKGSQKAQIWTLIGVLGTAVLGTVIRFVITALPGNP